MTSQASTGRDHDYIIHSVDRMHGRMSAPDEETAIRRRWAELLNGIRAKGELFSERRHGGDVPTHAVHDVNCWCRRPVMDADDLY